MKIRGGERGWRLLAMHDPYLRRGLWYRIRGGKVEFCAGREGDDAFAVVTSSPGLLDVLCYAEDQTDGPKAAIRAKERAEQCRVTRRCVYVRDHEGACWVLSKANR